MGNREGVEPSTRPVIVEFRSETEKWRVLERKARLRRSNIFSKVFLEWDLPQEKREEERLKHVMRRKEREEEKGSQEEERKKKKQEGKTEERKRRGISASRRQWK